MPENQVKQIVDPFTKVGPIVCPQCKGHLELAETKSGRYFIGCKGDSCSFAIHRLTTDGFLEQMVESFCDS